MTPAMQEINAAQQLWVSFMLIAVLCFNTVYNCAQAQIVPSGTETVVNSTTLNSQQNPQMAMDTSGSSLVVWESENEDGDGFGVYFQRLSETGTALGSATIANTTTTLDQRFPDVATNSSGSVSVIVWMSYSGTDWDIMARMFDGSGVALSAEIPVNDVTVDQQTHPSVCVSDNGSFKVSWTEHDAGDQNVKVRAFTNTGAALVSSAIVHSTTTGFQGYSSIACTGTGEAVVTWQDENDGSGHGVSAASLDTAGIVLTEIDVNGTTAGNQQEPDVAMDAIGNAVITWASFSQDGDAYGIFAQRFDNSLSTVGSEFQVNTSGTNSQNNPSVTMRNDGFFFIAWNSYSTDGDKDGVYLKGFTHLGDEFGDEMPVNSTTNGFQQFAAVGINGNSNELFAVWQDGDRNTSTSLDGSDYGIATQRFGVNDTTAPVAVCQDLTVYIDGSGMASITATDLDNGSTDNVEIDSMSIDISSFDCSDLGTVTVTLSVYDLTGNSSTCTSTVTVSDSAGYCVPNDLCVAPTVLTVSTYAGCNSPISGTTAAATGDDSPPSCAPTALQDVWYTFNSGSNTSIQVNLDQLTSDSLGFALYSGPDCNSLVEVSCFAHVMGSQIISTDTSTNYYVRVWSSEGTDIDFDICLQELPCGVAAPVISGFSNLSHHGATVNWSSAPLPTGGSFVVRYHEFGNSPNFTYINVPNESAVAAYANGLAPNTRYVFRVGSTCGSQSVAAFSDTMSVRTRPYCAPLTDLTAVRTSGTSADFSWTDTGADTYKMKYRKVGGNWIWRTISGPASGTSITNLNGTSAYEWTVRAICNDGGNQPYPALLTLATFSPRFTAIDEDLTVSTYPNPVDDLLNVVFNSNTEGSQSVSVLDLSGRTVSVDQIVANEGLNRIQLNTSDLMPGLYTVVISGTDSLHTTRFVRK